MFPPTRVLDDINYKAIMIGFPLLTLGIITGAAWANYAWGTYWSWDPKETWSLIVWFIYAAFIHARFTRGWVGRKAAWLSIFGFAATLFCYPGRQPGSVRAAFLRQRLMCGSSRNDRKGARTWAPALFRLQNPDKRILERMRRAQRKSKSVF